VEGRAVAVVFFVVGVAGCFAAAPFDEPEWEHATGPGSISRDGDGDADADGDGDGDGGEGEGEGGGEGEGEGEGEPEETPEEAAARELCGRYCQAREVCDGRPDPLCDPTCRCFVGRVVRPDWLGDVGECAVTLECDGGDPFPVCSGLRAAQGGATAAAQAAYDGCVAREAALGCPGTLDCAGLLAGTDQAAASVQPCMEETTCGAARDCAESALLALCLN